MPVVYNPNSFAASGHFDCDGIRLSTFVDHAATVVAAAGEIDASNIDRLTDCVQATLAGGRTLVLDLSELTFLGSQGIPSLFAINEQCSKVGVDWAVVPSHAVNRLLRIGDRDDRLPTAGSVAAAMKRLSAPVPARRLPQLVAKSR